MKNITLDRTTALQLDADGTDSALDAPTHCDLLRDYAALHLCAFADQEVRGAQLPFDSPKHLRCAIAFDAADNRHPGADARERPGFRQRVRSRSVQCSNRVLRR